MKPSPLEREDSLFVLMKTEAEVKVVVVYGLFVKPRAWLMLDSHFDIVIVVIVIVVVGKGRGF